MTDGWASTIRKRPRLFRRGALPVRLMILGSLLATGCATAVHWNGQVELPPVNHTAGKRVVVSDFLYSEEATSTTQSLDIETIKESVRVRDISGVVASKLEQKGVPAEARVDVKPAFLYSDELLLRGVIIAGQGSQPASNMVVILDIFTLGLFGGILPNPVPFKANTRVRYRVEVIDSRGRILLQTGDAELTASVDQYWLWQKGETYNALAGVVRDQIVDRLAPMLQAGLTTQNQLQGRSKRNREQSANAVRDRREAERLLAASTELRNQRHYVKSIPAARKALKLAEQSIRQENRDLLPYVHGLALSYTGAYRETKKFEYVSLARPFWIRTYQISLHQLGRDDRLTRSVEKFLVDVYGTEALREASH